MQTGTFYVFRTTTEKMSEHHQHILDSGDSVVTEPHFVGGRDWLLLCRKGGPAVELGAALGTVAVALNRLTAKLESFEKLADRARSGARQASPARVPGGVVPGAGR